MLMAGSALGVLVAGSMEVLVAGSALQVVVS